MVVVLMGLIFVFSLSGVGVAQEKGKPGKPAEAAKPAEPAKPAEAKPEAAKPEAAKKEAPAKPVAYRMGGSVVSVDAAAQKITIKQDSVKQQKKVTLSVGKKAAKDLAGINVGDVVNVWVTDKTVTGITKIF